MRIGGPGRTLDGPRRVRGRCARSRAATRPGAVRFYVNGVRPSHSRWSRALAPGYDRAVRYTVAAPGPALRPFVRSLWHYEGYAPDHALERVLPSGTVELVVLLDGDTLPLHDPNDPTGPPERMRLESPLVVGTHRAFHVIDTEPQRHCLGVHFRPGAAGALLGLPARELADAQLPLDALWSPGSARDLWARLREAPTATDRFRILQASLLERANDARPPPAWLAPALSALHTLPAPPIGQLARRLGVSRRRFVEGFAAAVGLTPKTYGRVVRFQRALVRLRAEGPVDLARWALELGYFDQAHLNRDFRAFSGQTPTAFRRVHTEPTNPVPEAERGQILPIRAPSPKPT